MSLEILSRRIFTGKKGKISILMNNVCSNCLQNNPPNVTNCLSCGAALLKNICPRCNQGIRPSSKFCPFCGIKFGSKPPRNRSDEKQRELRERTLLLKEQFGQMITQSNYREVLQRDDNQITKTFIDFIAWGITRFWSFTAFMAAVTILGILLGGWGIVLAVVLTYVYSTHKTRIMQRIKEMKSEEGLVKKKTREYAFFIDEHCNACGICVDVCPRNAIFPVQRKYAINDEICDLCGKCYYECPVGAIIKID